MFANSEVQILPPGSSCLDASCSVILQCGFVRRSKICRSAKEPRDVLCEDVQHDAGRFAPGDPLWVGRKDRKVAFPPGWKVASLYQINFGGESGIFCAILRKEFRPFPPRLGTAGPYPRRKVLINAVRHEESRFLGPAISAFGEADLVISQRLTVSFWSILFVG